MGQINKIIPTEHQIQTLLKNYLTAKGWYVMRLNSGRIPMTDQIGRRRMIWMGEKGTPDLMAFKKFRHGEFLGKEYATAEILFIEVKRPGKKPTFNQEQMMKLLEEKGAKCIVASSIEDLQREGI